MDMQMLARNNAHLTAALDEKEDRIDALRNKILDLQISTTGVGPAAELMESVVKAETPRVGGFTHSIDQLQVVVKYFLVAMASGHMSSNSTETRHFLHSMSMKDSSSIRIHPFILFQIEGVRYVLSAIAKDGNIILWLFLADEYENVTHNLAEAGLNGSDILHGHDPDDPHSADSLQKTEIIKRARKQLRLGKVKVPGEVRRKKPAIVHDRCEAAAAEFAILFRTEHMEDGPSTKTPDPPVRVDEVHADGVAVQLPPNLRDDLYFNYESSAWRAGYTLTSIPF